MKKRQEDRGSSGRKSHFTEDNTGSHDSGEEKYTSGKRSRSEIFDRESETESRPKVHFGEEEKDTSPINSEREKPQTHVKRARASSFDRDLTPAEEEYVEKIRQSAEREKLVVVDCSYMAGRIEGWWNDHNGSPIQYPYIRGDKASEALKEDLKKVILDNMREDGKENFSLVGKPGSEVAAVCFTGLFGIDDINLSLLVHEALSDLFNIDDMKYPYEDHKVLYTKPEGLNFKEWGNGRGEITPHIDDAYEPIDTDLLSLTVARDETRTATTLYLTKGILNTLSNADILRLSKMTADFISGKNVSGDKGHERKVLCYDPEYDDVIMAFDYRVDPEKGQRMFARLRSDEALLRRIGENFENYDHVASVPEIGTYFIAANQKGLHSRYELNFNEEQKKRVMTGEIEDNPRVLYRSKGPGLLQVGRASTSVTSYGGKSEDESSFVDCIEVKDRAEVGSKEESVLQRVMRRRLREEAKKETEGR